MIEQASTDFDVLIIGAGISGINAAYRLQTQAPHFSYTILEARGGIGGTWDFFKYPGIRSDSDLYTFGFPWRPWAEQKAIADGASIVNYIRKTAAMEGIDKKVQLHHKVNSADWSTDQQRWRLNVDVKGESKTVHGRFILFSTGYYDYANPLPTTIKGLENFKGTVVHPQYWPSDMDYTDKKMVIVGSGATAVTLLPNLAQKAAKVTMLQRSPSYVMTIPNRGDSWVNRYLPLSVAQRIGRIMNLILPFLFFNFCRAFPNAARNLLRKRTMAQLPKNIPHDPHFNPTYNPWEQRMCMTPDGDFYEALRSGKGDIATGKIDTMTDHSIVLESGQEIEADIIVTATGLKILMAGGTEISVDGEPYKPSDHFMWKGVMLQDLPNAAVVIGYTNASWTLGADATAQMVTRLLNNMEKMGTSSFVPRLEDGETMKSAPMLNLNSTYVQAALDRIPKAGDRGQWVPRKSYFQDIYQAKFGDVTTGLQFNRVST